MTCMTYDVGLRRPGVLVRHNPICTWLPAQGTVLLQQSLETRASRSSIQPDRQGVRGGVSGGRPVPEEQLAGLVLARRDWKSSRPGWLEIERDERKVGRVDFKVGGVGIAEDGGVELGSHSGMVRGGMYVY
jgi:hypothetical protein